MHREGRAKPGKEDANGASSSSSLLMKQLRRRQFRGSESAEVS